jgi:DNA-directed RNA polymerase subunit RPC12/RpoP
MLKLPIDIDSVMVSYKCKRCKKLITDIPVQESIYNGPPLCTDCEEEMDIVSIYYVIG